MSTTTNLKTEAALIAKLARYEARLRHAGAAWALVEAFAATGGLKALLGSKPPKATAADAEALLKRVKADAAAIAAEKTAQRRALRASEERLSRR